MSEHCCQHEHEEADWLEQLKQLLPLLGHRNWIVIADAAYPLQVKQGIETLLANEPVDVVLGRLLKVLGNNPHIRPISYLDAELIHLGELGVAGADALSSDLVRQLGEAPETRPHEQMLAAIDAAAATYTVVVIKTSTTIPYTSVFLSLECGYWSETEEATLRERMRNQA